MKLIGDWEKAAKLADGLAGRFQKSVNAAVMAEGQYLRGQIVKGIRSGAPGGKQFAPLSPTTIAIRKFRGFGGSKPLVATGALVSSITATRTAGGAVFVGLLRQAKSKGGKSLANLGEIHEFGASWTQTLTPKARRFLFAALKASGMSHGTGDHVTLKSGARVMKRGGRWRDGRGRFLSGAQLAEAKAASEAARSAAKAAPKPGSSTITITIPARPFIGPVLEKEAKPEAVQKRFWDRVAKGMGYDLGKP